MDQATTGTLAPQSSGATWQDAQWPVGHSCSALEDPGAVQNGDFLFLQGVNSPFFHKLAMALTKRGHHAGRVNFNGGDRLFWPSGRSTDFCGPPAEWTEFLSGVLRRGVTDIVLHGDCRPLHHAAIAVAAAQGVRVRVFEEGYMRPDWVTLELGGVNGHSSLPQDPAWFLEAGRDLAEPPPACPGPNPAGTRARLDMSYAAAEAAMALRFRHYQTHRPWSPWREGWGWGRRLLARPAARRRSAKVLNGLVGSGQHAPFFVLPLQLDSDCQITTHSPFSGIAEVIDHVLASLARAAPPPVRLAIKAHPLHNGLRDWASYTQDAAARYGVAHRVVFLEEGMLEPVLARASGMVTVNSTAGTLALGMGVPVLTLGRAVYGMPGLAAPADELDGFWGAPQRPDAELFAAFHRVLAARCMIRGDFYTADGIARAVAGAIPRLELTTTPLPNPRGEAS